MTTIMPPTKNQRLPAIDVFRALTILAMLIVNEMAAVKSIPAFFKHVAASQDGMSFADLIFPAFLFITGMAIPASNKTPAAGLNLWGSAQRSLALITLGLFMVNAEYGYALQLVSMPAALWALLSLLACFLIWGNLPRLTLPQLRALRLIGIASLLILALLYRTAPDQLTAMRSHWWGILGLIGWAYLITVAILRFMPNSPYLLALASLGLILAYCLPASPMSHNPHLSHSAIMLFGVVCYQLLYPPQSAPATLTTVACLKLLALTGLLFLAALLSHQFFAFSKIAASPPWVLASSAFCCLCYLLIALSLQRWDWHLAFPKLMLASQNALLCYVLPYLIYPLMLLCAWHYPWVDREAWAASLMITLYALALIYLAAILQKHKIRWQI